MAQKILRASARTADVQCSTCLTVQTVERDADGAGIDQDPCHDDTCGARLCEHCPRFDCSSCGLPHCTSHRVRIGEEEFCGVCVRAYVEDAIAEYAEVIEEFVEVAA